jgi:hypothetical protein
MRVLSIAKLGENLVNEDAAKATQEWIVVSDGAGGGGVFADRWSKYLVEHLPDKPVTDYSIFDSWIDGIWESFYNECEEIAKREGGMLLNKFYDEGSFATLVAIWKDGRWVSYGDSVGFCYNKNTDKLQHTFGRIVDFNNPPFLINCKDPSDEKGFKVGKFKVDKDCIVFACSDALAHYVLMMYEVTHQDSFREELLEAINSQTKDSNFIKTAMRLRKADFDKDVIGKLLNCKNAGNFKRHLESLRKKGLIGHDDYSLVIM